MRHFLLFLLLCLLLPLAATDTNSLLDHLLNDPAERPHVELHLPLDSLAERNPMPQPTSFRYGDLELRAKITLRGRYRRLYCDHAPLKIDFDKSQLRALGISDFDKYKIVVPCHPGKHGSELLEREYLAYQTYNLLTPNSFRVRKIELVYMDNEGHAMRGSGPAFLIESPRELAARLGLERVDNALGIRAEEYDAAAETTHALFQYLIGNGDWSPTIAHNVKVFRRPDGLLVPIGYDFDFSNWVAADYAVPTAGIGRKRVYLGYAHGNAVMTAVLERFMNRKQEIRRLVAHNRTLRRYTTGLFKDLARTQGRGSNLYANLRGNQVDVVPVGGEAAEYWVEK